MEMTTTNCTTSNINSATTVTITPNSDEEFFDPEEFARFKIKLSAIIFKFLPSIEPEQIEDFLFKLYSFRAKTNFDLEFGNAQKTPSNSGSSVVFDISQIGTPTQQEIDDFEARYENDSEFPCHKKDSLFTKLHFVAKIDDLKMGLYLISNGADINSKTISVFSIQRVLFINI